MWQVVAAAESELPPDKLRAAIEVLDGEPILPPALLAFIERAAAYYHHPLGAVVAAPARRQRHLRGSASRCRPAVDRVLRAESASSGQDAKSDGASFEAGIPKPLFDVRLPVLGRNHFVATKDGLRFLVVTAGGALQPCSMQFKRYALADRSKMIEEFTRTNTCDECYVSIRSYLDKSFPVLLWENVSGFFSFKTDRQSA